MPNPAAGAPQPSTQAPRILLAEDDRELRRVLVAVLRRAGYAVLEASNGQMALRVLATGTTMGRPVDVIVTDVRMPGVDGLTLARGLFRAKYTIPVVVMTAFGDAELHAAAGRAGAVVVLDKPFDPAQLRDAVASALETQAA